jgi:signal transduction histidine kinase
MNLYGIPPLLSAIILFILFLMGILRARKSRVSLLFALICLIGFLLNVDKAILTSVRDSELAIRISRLDHLFLAFVIPLYLHFTVMVTGHKRWITLVKIYYAVALLLMPITQHRLYLPMVKEHTFGLFATPGPLFYVFGIFSMSSIGFSLYLLVRTLKNEKVAAKKVRIKYILLSFGCSALVTHLDIVTMQGLDVYPLGNFVFVPMSLLGYAILKHDVMEWKIFLSKGIVLCTLLLMSVGFFVGLEVLLKSLFSDSVNADLLYIASMIATVFLVYFSSRRVQDFVTQFLQQEFLNNRKAIKELSIEILTLNSVSKIRTRIVERLSRAFALVKCDVRMVAHIDQFEQAGVLDEKDPLWRQGYRLLIPVQSRSCPSLMLLGEKGNMGLYTNEEIEILLILATNVALAYDNAASYKKLEDFSDSLEKLVDQRTKALIQSESLAAVGRLAAGVAHELNNPIASVMSTLEYHVDHLVGPDELRDDLTFSLSEVKRARDIVKSLLDASRQKDEVRELVDIHTPIEDALKILYNQYKTKSIVITRELNAGNSVIEGNTGRLCQVFINMIRNAIDAIGEGTGHIMIGTANQTGPASPGNPGDKGQILLICTVRDDGPGIEKRIQKDIFKPFFTTKQPGKGVGLGLFIVHEIIKDHNGSIEVKSSKGEGATFTLTFPCHQQ